MLLARLQDECPSFLNHTFAITGVSGGAVGAALFDALARTDAAAPDDLRCSRRAAPFAPGSLSGMAADIAMRDHFSPVVSMLMPELIRGPVLDLYHSYAPAQAAAEGSATRARALEDSLVRALEDTCARLNAQARPCSETTRSALRDAYGSTWKDRPVGPALVLTTTNADGKTVAFSPFKLWGLGEGDIWAFSDEPFAPYAAKRNAHLITAAVASARFPIVMAPFALRDEKGGSWSFVDGGYADNSGVATAGAIYQALRKPAEDNNIDLRLLVLTGDEGEEGGLRGLGTSVLADILVPLEAMFNVRAGIGPREVVRAMNQINAASNEQEALQPVSLLRFHTPFLGWTISRTSNDFLAKTLAPGTSCVSKPERSRRINATAQGSRERWVTALVLENACTISNIVELLRPPESPKPN
jgi:hypothetical protein